MGYLSYGYKASKTPLGKKVVETVKNIFKGKKGSGEAIKKFDPNVSKTRLEKAESRLKIQQHKTKMAGAKLNQTNFEIQNPKVSKGKYTFDPGKRNVVRESVKKRNEESKKMFRGAQGKAKGGRVGLKRGTSLTPKKSNVQKIKETFGPRGMAKNKKASKFGMLSVKAGIDKNPNPTQADRIAGAKMKNKKRFV